MSEEENRAIEDLKRLRKGIEILNQVAPEKDDVDIKAINTILNLINKQQEKIVDLETKLSIETIDNKYNQEERDEETIPRYKIRERIKDLEDLIETEKPTYIDTLEYTIDILKELLEEN